MAHQIPTVEKGTWMSMLWTGRAFRKARVDVDMSLKFDGDTIIPAMPDDPFMDEKCVKNFYMGVTNASSKHRHAESLTTQLQVDCIPLKPKHDKLRDARHVAAIKNSHDSLDTFYCDKIIPINIGANRGLLQILRDHMVDKCQLEEECTRYTVFNVDVDIYLRMMKVLTTVCQMSVHNHLYVTCSF
jgi:hypothetical protein